MRIGVCDSEREAVVLVAWLVTSWPVAIEGLATW